MQVDFYKGPSLPFYKKHFIFFQDKKTQSREGNYQCTKISTEVFFLHIQEHSSKPKTWYSAW